MRVLARHGDRRRRRRRRRAAAPQRPAHRRVRPAHARRSGRTPARSSTSTPPRSCARSSSTSSASPRRRRPRPATPPTPPRSRSCAGQHPIIEHLLRYREVEKLRSHLRRGPAGRGRRPTAASTPRSTRPWPAPAGSAPTQPNLHNIPVRTEDGPGVPQGVRARPTGFELLVADYNQIELRCIAHLAEDPGLIEAFDVGHRHPHRDRVADLRRRARRRDARAAVEGEDGLLRPGLRHGGLRPRPAPRHPDRARPRRSSTPTSWPSRR